MCIRDSSHSHSLLLLPSFTLSRSSADAPPGAPTGAGKDEKGALRKYLECTRHTRNRAKAQHSFFRCPLVSLNMPNAVLNAVLSAKF
eukprot:3788092-Rhodomonas_salina.2